MTPDPLTPHPEGGRFREVFRSARIVHDPDRGERRALTHIYFHLAEGETSAFHRVSSDEVWSLYRGVGVRLYLWDGHSQAIQEIVLSAAESRYCTVVPAGTWQAAEPVGGDILVGCTVGPGFEFEDFELMAGDSAEAVRLMALRRGIERMISGK